MARKQKIEPASNGPKSAQEVVNLVEAWLKDDANVQSLKATYAEADRMAKELTDRSRLHADEPLRVVLGGARSDAT